MPRAPEVVEDMRVKRLEREERRRDAERLRLLQHAENVWRGEIERLRAEVAALRFALSELRPDLADRWDNA